MALVRYSECQPGWVDYNHPQKIQHGFILPSGIFSDVKNKLMIEIPVKVSLYAANSVFPINKQKKENTIRF